MKFKDQVAVIIGGSSGIGFATAQRIIADGGQVIVTGRDPGRLKNACVELGSQATGVSADALNEDDTRNLFANLERIDHLFSTAGEFLADDQNLLIEDAVLRVGMESRFWSAVKAVKHALPKMSGQGSVVFMSGTANWRPEGSCVAAASTGAMESLARQMAVQFAPIRFNCVAPGYTKTPFVESLLGEECDEVLEEISKTIPVGRVGTPDDIADAVVFLMGNGYANGITLTVDGGAILR